MRPFVSVSCEKIKPFMTKTKSETAKVKLPFSCFSWPNLDFGELCTFACLVLNVEFWVKKGKNCHTVRRSLALRTALPASNQSQPERQTQD